MIDWGKGFLYKFVTTVIRYLPPRLFGDSEIIRNKYCCYYDRKNSDEKIADARFHTAANYLLIFLAFIILFALTQILKCIPNEDKDMGAEIYRVMAEYDGTKVYRNVRIEAKRVPLTLSEKENSMRSLNERLIQYIKGENTDLEHVEFDLNLPEKEEKTGILIRWSSDNPDVLDEKGKIDSIAAKEGAKVILTAEAHLDDMTLQIPFEINIIPLKGHDHTKALEKRLNDALANKDVKGKTGFPDRLEEGISITWNGKRSDAFLVLAISMPLLLFFAYLFRYERPKKQKRDASESIRTDLPDFADKLILLLNAGLVTETAIKKIINDYEMYRKEKVRPLYEGLREAEKRASGTNYPLIKELRTFAKESEVKEFMSFTAILADNVDKGGSLAEKLGNEAAFLWFARKKKAQEQGRLAETKLALPLMLQLLILVLITIAPIMIKI